MTETQPTVLPQDHPVVAEINGMVVELDKLLESYREIDIKNYLREALKEHDTIAKDVAWQLLFGHFGMSFTAEIANKIYYKASEEEQNEELSESMQRFFDRLATRLMHTDSISRMMNDMIREKLENYMDSSQFHEQMDRLVSAKTKEIIENRNLKITLG